MFSLTFTTIKKQKNCMIKIINEGVIKKKETPTSTKHALKITKKNFPKIIYFHFTKF